MKGTGDDCETRIRREYLMESSGEAERVHRKTDRRLTIEQMRLIGLAPGHYAVDVGCAGGTSSAIMADLVGPTGRIFGIDGSAERIAEAPRLGNDRPNVSYVEADAACLPLDDCSCDVAWSRFLLEYIADWRPVLSEMRRVVRPGGVLAVSDIDGNCVWHDGMPDNLERRVAEAIRTMRPDFDPHAGRRLFGELARHGILEVQVDARIYHSIFGRITADDEGHWSRKLAGVERSLVTRGWSSGAAGELRRDFMEFLRDPATATYSLLVTAWGRIPRRDVTAGQGHGTARTVSG